MPNKVSPRRRSTHRAILETLESRTLLHGAFQANINFQPASAPVPAGYLVDSGNVYGDRGNGLQYGWSRDLTIGATVDRNSSRSPDQRYDTLTMMQYYGAASWEIQLENGPYNVHLVAGDAPYVNTAFKINVENVLVVDGYSTGTQRFIEGTATVNVTDGRLTVSNAPGSGNNKVCFIEITAVEPGGQSPPMVELTAPANNASASAGSSLTIRASASDDGSISRVEFFDGATKLGEDLAAPYEYIWNNLPTGAHSLTAVATDNDGMTANSAPVALNVTAPPAGQSPFSGTPVVLPNTFQAEDFDNGGEGVAYHDVDVTNRGTAPAYRSTSVDIQSVTDGGAGFGVGYIRATEWLEYTIDVPSSGDWILETRFASGNNGGTAHVEFNGVDRTGAIVLGNTGGWNTYRSFTRTVALTAGTQVMRFVFDASAASGQDIGNLNYFRLTSAAAVTLAAPTRLAAFNVFSEQVNLIWTDNAINETGFTIDRKTGAGGVWATVGTAGANATQYYDPSAVPGTTYIYRVMARDNALASAPSNEATSVTDTEPAWTIATSLAAPEARERGVAVELRGKLYVFGGLVDGTTASRRVDVLDPRTGTWTTLADLPASAGVYAQGIASDGASIFIVGGRDEAGVPVSSVYRFNPTAGTYTPLPNLPSPTPGAAAVVFGNDLYAMGGAFSGAVYRLNFADPATWSARADLPVAVGHAGAVIIDGKIYVVGGLANEAGQAVAQRTLFRYDPTANVWTARADMPTELSHLTSSTIAVDGKIIVAGGQRTDGAPRSQVFAFDPLSNQWIELASLSAAREGGALMFIDQSLIYASGNSSVTLTSPFASQPLTWQQTSVMTLRRTEANVGNLGGRMIVFGGYIDSTFYPTRQVHSYDPVTRIWTRLNDMPQSLTHMGTAEEGNRLWMVGGYFGNASGSGQTFATTRALIYDSITDTYTDGPPLPAARGAGTASIVGRELHYFGGGNSSRTDMTTHWALDLDNTSAGWQTRAPLPTPRNHVASATLNGKIYVIGGQQGSTDTTGVQSVVEMYDPVTDTWQTRAPLPIPLGHIKSSTLVVDGRILVLGGATTNAASRSTVHAYNDRTNTWSLLTSLPNARSSGSVIFQGGKLIFAGGLSGGIMDQVWETAV